MSFEITTAMVQQFSGNVELQYQQAGSRLRGAVRTEKQRGEVAYYDQIGATEAVKREGRHGPTPLVETPHARRQVTTEDYDWADLVDPLDLNKTLVDPTSKYSLNAGNAMGRAMDAELIRAFFATAKTGKTGTTSTAFDTSNQQIAAFATGLTLAKLITAAEILNNADVPDEDRHIVVTGTQISDLLGDSKITSADYAAVKALVKGDINSFMGFTFHKTNLLGVDSSSNRRIAVWSRNAMLLAIGQDAQGAIEKRPDLNGATQVRYTMTIGATRMQEAGVVEILCAES